MRPFLLRKAARLLLGGAACWLLLSIPVARAEPIQVSVVLSESGGAYSEFADALRENLLNSNVTVNVVDANTQPPSSSRLVIAVGMKAASMVAGSNAPAVLNVMLPQAGYKKLLHDFPRRENSTSFSSIYLDQPVERQLSLIAAAFPERTRIGILFESPPPDELEQLRQKVSEYGFSLYEQEVGKIALFESLQKVLQHSDVLLALPTPAVYNSSTVRNILLSTYQAGIPLVGFSSSFVKAGAMYAVFTSPAQFATQTAVTIRKYIESGILPPAQYPRYFEVAVNDRVAQSLKIDIKSQDELVRKISTTKRQMP